MQDKDIRELVTWEALVSPTVVRLKNRAFMSCIRYLGVDAESLTDEQLKRYSAQISNILRRLKGGWTIQSEANRHRVWPYREDIPKWPTLFPGVLDNLRRDVAMGATYFQTEYTLTLTWLPPVQKRSGLSTFFWDSGKREATGDDILLDEFETQVHAINDPLTSVLQSATVLSQNDLLSYLHQSVTTRRHPVILENAPGYLDLRLPDEELTVVPQFMLGETHHIRVVGVRAYPEFTEPALLRTLDSLSFPYRYCTRWVAWDKEKALRSLRFMQSMYKSAEVSVVSRLIRRYDKGNTDPPTINEDAQRKAMELGSEVEATSRERVGYGEWSANVVLMDADERTVNDHADKVLEKLNRLGFMAVTESINAAEAWMSCIPGDTKHNPVSAPVHSLHAANLMPLTALWGGLEQDKSWGGDPLFVSAATGATPFRVVLHEEAEASGHTLILGPSGSGKTVLLRMMMLNLQRYEGMRVVAFDRNYGLYSQVALCEGAYEDMGARVQAGEGVLQPLARLNQPGELPWIQSWLERIFAADGVFTTPEQNQALYEGLKVVATFKPELRTLTNLRYQVQDTVLQAALMPYTFEGAWGNLFDAGTDQFNIAQVQTFEMGALLQSERIGGAMINWMLHRLEDFAGQPMAIIVDELSFYLKHPQFRDALIDWIKTARVKKWVVIGATQSIADIDTSELAAVLSEAFPNRILLPNDRATDHYPTLMYRAYGLNDAEIERLASALPMRDYYWSSAQGRRMFQLGLSDLEKAVLAGNTVTEKRRMELADGSGIHRVSRYLENLGYDDLAEALVEPEHKEVEPTIPSTLPILTGANA